MKKQNNNTQIKKEKVLWSAIRFFLTFPNLENTLQFESYYEKLNKRFPNEIKSLIIAKEKHENNKPHLHILIIFRKKKITNNPNYFDFICDKHGHYETVRDLNKVTDYIKKDKDFKAFGDPIDLKKINDTPTLLRDLLKTPEYRPEALFENLTNELDAAIYNDGSKIDIYSRRYQSYLHYEKLKQKHVITEFSLDKIQNAPTKFQPYAKACLPVLQFLNLWMNNRRYKAKNLFLWSHEPNMGKSSLFNTIAEISPTYEWPTDNWFQEYRNYAFQFIIWDELTLIGFREEFLKNFFAGNGLQLPIKGTHILKKDNPMIISSSNYSLTEIFQAKFSVTCKCPKTNPRTFCSNLNECTTPQNIKNLYKAIYARLIPMEIKDPLFPNGDAEPELFYEWKQFL